MFHKGYRLRISKLILIATLLTVGGCSTIKTYDSHPPKVFSGVRNDIEIVTMDSPPQFYAPAASPLGALLITGYVGYGIIDFPFSLIMDTLLFPYQYSKQVEHKEQVAEKENNQEMSNRLLLPILDSIYGVNSHLPRYNLRTQEEMDQYLAAINFYKNEGKVREEAFLRAAIGDIDESLSVFERNGKVFSKDYWYLSLITGSHDRYISNLEDRYTKVFLYYPSSYSRYGMLSSFYALTGRHEDNKRLINKLIEIGPPKTENQFLVELYEGKAKVFYAKVNKLKTLSKKIRSGILRFPEDIDEIDRLCGC